MRDFSAPVTQPQLGVGSNNISQLSTGVGIHQKNTQIDYTGSIARLSSTQGYEFTSKTKSAYELASVGHAHLKSLRFSKHSININLLTIDDNDGTDSTHLKDLLAKEATIEGGGVCVVLCRALLYRVCTVPGVIEGTYYYY